MTKVFARHVPNFIACYEKEFSKDELKKIAKEIVKVLVDKELRHVNEATDAKFEISESRKKKVKEFSRQFMDKIVLKRGAKQQRHEAEKKRRRESQQGSLGKRRHTDACGEASVSNEKDGVGSNTEADDGTSMATNGACRASG
jgi:histone-lysine N-methyltransferase SETD2